VANKLDYSMYWMLIWTAEMEIVQLILSQKVRFSDAQLTLPRHTVECFNGI
jgi:hypothetical protein